VFFLLLQGPYDIIAENDMRAALRMTQNHLASAKEKAVAMPAAIN
jgi:hypothetical protein